MGGCLVGSSFVLSLRSCRACSDCLGSGLGLLPYSYTYIKRFSVFSCDASSFLASLTRSTRVLSLSSFFSPVLVLSLSSSPTMVQMATGAILGSLIFSIGCLCSDFYSHLSHRSQMGQNTHLYRMPVMGLALHQMQLVLGCYVRVQGCTDDFEFYDSAYRLYTNCDTLPSHFFALFPPPSRPPTDYSTPLTSTLTLVTPVATSDPKSYQFISTIISPSSSMQLSAQFAGSELNTPLMQAVNIWQFSIGG